MLIFHCNGIPKFSKRKVLRLIHLYRASHTVTYDDGWPGYDEPLFDF